MTAFAEVLRSYRHGDVDRRHLLAEVDRILASSPGVARSLRAYVHTECANHRLSADTQRELLQHIDAWLDDRTIVNRAALRDDTVEMSSGAHGPQRAADDSRGVDQALSDASAAPTAAAMEAPRETIGVGSVLLHRFKLIEQIGEGGMSRVYKAIDLRKVEAHAADPHLAVKVLTVPFKDQFRSSALLHGEAHKLQSLTHPNIVRVIDCDRDGLTVFMTMEFLDGESLKTRLDAARAGTAAVQDASRIVSCIAEALEFAHRSGIVHGDLKPGNVILTSKGDVKVIDFGIARFISQSLAREGEPLEQETIDGLTPPYASPEMLRGANPDPRDDVYALACISYELLTGVHPFDRLAADAAQDRQLRPRRRRPLTGAQYKAISHALAFDRSQRTPSAREFIEQFKGGATRLPRHYGAIALIVLVAVAAGYLINERFDRQAPQPPAAVDPSARSALTVPGTVFRDCPTCPLMVVLPRGRFMQGTAPVSSEAGSFEQPQHEVAINDLIAVGQHEVTVGEFSEYVEATAQNISGCAVYDGEWRFRNDVSWKTADSELTALHPVACVSWDDANGYAEWLSGKTRQSYRLASASEWEYAAAAGLRPATVISHSLCTMANVADQSAAQAYPGWMVHECHDGYPRTAPVGSFASNSFGLQDTLGNVFEWVQDCWHDNYVGAPADGSAWLSGDCREREMRGGSWFTSPGFVRPTYRNRFASDYRSTSIGFRVTREIRDES